jgi:uncharacterized membrane protein YkoI
MKHSKIAMVACLAAVLTTPAVFAHGKSHSKKAPESEAELMKEVKISKEKAEEIALKKGPGKVESSELEREHGKLVWSFDIRNAKGTITEVLVNAVDGSVVSVTEESKAKEAAEKKKEAEEKKKH